MVTSIKKSISRNLGVYSPKEESIKTFLLTAALGAPTALALKFLRVDKLDIKRISSWFLLSANLAHLIVSRHRRGVKKDAEFLKINAGLMLLVPVMGASFRRPALIAILTAIGAFQVFSSIITWRHEQDRDQKLEDAFTDRKEDLVREMVKKFSMHSKFCDLLFQCTTEKFEFFIKVLDRYIVSDLNTKQKQRIFYAAQSNGQILRRLLEKIPLTKDLSVQYKHVNQFKGDQVQSLLKKGYVTPDFVANGALEFDNVKHFRAAYPSLGMQGQVRYFQVAAVRRRERCFKYVLDTYGDAFNKRLNSGDKIRVLQSTREIRHFKMVWKVFGPTIGRENYDDIFEEELSPLIKCPALVGRMRFLLHLLRDGLTDRAIASQLIRVSKRSEKYGYSNLSTFIQLYREKREELSTVANVEIVRHIIRRRTRDDDVVVECLNWMVPSANSFFRYHFYNSIATFRLRLLPQVDHENTDVDTSLHINQEVCNLLRNAAILSKRILGLRLRDRRPTIRKDSMRKIDELINVSLTPAIDLNSAAAYLIKKDDYPDRLDLLEKILADPRVTYREMAQWFVGGAQQLCLKHRRGFSGAPVGPLLSLIGQPSRKVALRQLFSLWLKQQIQYRTDRLKVNLLSLELE